jgi:ribosome-associated protein
MLKINSKLFITEQEYEITAIRSQGPGGQNVNKVASAAHLRFDCQHSSLPQVFKTRLMELKDHRITKDGLVVIKAQNSRSFEKNKQEACDRLIELIKRVTVTKKARRATKATKGSQERRLSSKSIRSKTKSLRGKFRDE